MRVRSPSFPFCHPSLSRLSSRGVVHPPVTQSTSSAVPPLHRFKASKRLAAPANTEEKNRQQEHRCAVTNQHGFYYVERRGFRNCFLFMCFVFLFTFPLGLGLILRDSWRLNGLFWGVGIGGFTNEQQQRKNAHLTLSLSSSYSFKIQPEYTHEEEPLRIEDFSALALAFAFLFIPRNRCSEEVLGPTGKKRKKKKYRHWYVGPLHHDTGYWIHFLGTAVLFPPAEKKNIFFPNLNSPDNTNTNTSGKDTSVVFFFSLLLHMEVCRRLEVHSSEENTSDFFVFPCRPSTTLSTRDLNCFNCSEQQQQQQQKIENFHPTD
eukprot:gene8221-5744_t